MKYRGEKTKEISFPLGGIGAGCIGIAGDGRLIDWEICNKPNKNSLNGFSHFAVKAEDGDRVLDTRVLAGRLKPPYSGTSATGNHSHGFGFGPNRATMAGLPNFGTVDFSGEYPFATLTFRDRKFPGTVTMTAWSPFIPLNDRDSSIPASFFEITVTNTGKKALTYTAACTMRNPLPENTVNRHSCAEGISSIKLASTKYAADDVAFGDCTVATDARDTSFQEYWFRGTWFDNLGIYWQDITRPGAFKDRTYDAPAKDDHATLAARISVAPGKTERVRFVISWNFPNCTNYWNPEKCNCEGECKDKPRTWKNYYAALFGDSTASARYSLTQWQRMYDETRKFKDALFGSTLPPALIDAISANLSILKSPTCLRLENGEFYGWEGCYGNAGCCEGSCTHVWNYAYALPFLFPKLERSMRDLNYRFNQREDGGMVFRIKLPLGRDRGAMRPCADGQFGDVIKAYRDWKICGDTEWLRTLWPAVKKSIEFAWAPTNEDAWDADKDGVLEGRQHHTLDMELFGPNSWLTGFYLAALKAGSEMAAAMGEDATAKEYRALFEKGKAWTDEHLFNGTYYQQDIGLKDRSIVEKFGALNYWNDEHKEMKYQIGEGSSIDQVLAQWHANLCGLGDIFDRKKRRSALRSIYRHNYKRSFADYVNPCRLYSVYDEKGVVICDWPEGTYKPVVPVPYSEETFYGCEYSAASHMIQEGLVDEGIEIATEVRKKFDGEKRNPWNEFECGSNYARSMASYALLNAMSGFEYDMTKGMIEFSPRVKGTFRTFWSLDGAWGTAELSSAAIALTVLYGELKLSTIRSSVLAGKKVSAALVGKRPLRFVPADRGIQFDEALQLKASEVCVIRFAGKKAKR
ncbi:MAG: GH116 family glycosyl-hydrolase [Spirochaetota bacterium]